MGEAPYREPAGGATTGCLWLVGPMTCRRKCVSPKVRCSSAPGPASPYAVRPRAHGGSPVFPTFSAVTSFFDRAADVLSTVSDHLYGDLLAWLLIAT